MLFYFNKKKYIIFFVILFPIILTEEDLNPNINNILSFINDEIIQNIRTKPFDFVNNIIIPDEIKEITVKYNQTITLKNKNVVKINETHFQFFELNGFNNFCYNKFQIINNNDMSLINEHCLNNVDDINLYFNLTDIEYLEGKYISEKKLLLTGIIKNNFEIIIIDLDNEEIRINIVPQDSNIIEIENNLYEKTKIQCESFDGINFLCILSFLKEDNLKLLYNVYNLNIIDNYLINKGSGIICDNNCFLGNIIRANNIIGKYLICYQKYSEGFLYIICQYYSFSDNNIIIDISYEVGKISGEPIINKSLILLLYKDSIFIQFDSKSNNLIESILIICSLDLKINIKSILVEGNSVSTINIINDDYNLYIFYKEEIGEESLKIKNKKFKECLNSDYISLSNEKKEMNFIDGHINDFIFFSLNENVKLYKDEEIINNLNENNYMYLESDTKLEFEKLGISGVFQSFYSYASSEKDGFYNNFSLICPITITNCYSTCKTCISNKISSSDEHFCTSCINNYNPLINEKDKKDGYNCYFNNNISTISTIIPTTFRLLSAITFPTIIPSTEPSFTIKNILTTIPITIPEKIPTTIPSYISTSIPTTILITTIPTTSPSTIPPNIPTTFITNTIPTSIPTTILTIIPTTILINIPTTIFTNIPSTITETIPSNIQTTIIKTIPTNIPTYIQTSFIKTIFTTIPTIIVTTIPNIINLENYSSDNSNTINYTYEEKLAEINNNEIVCKNLPNTSNYNFQEILDKNIILDYNSILKEEKVKNQNKKIYLIGYKKYANYTVTIYPLDIEEKVEEKINEKEKSKENIEKINLIFGNFKKIFNFIDYEIKHNCLILIILIENF